MFKKLIVTGAVVATLLGSAVPAFASHSSWMPSQTTNVAIVDQKGLSLANTGGNSQTGGNSRGHRNSSGQMLMTGNAQSLTQLNADVSNGCGCDVPNNRGGNVNTNVAIVTQVGLSVANTGMNTQTGNGGLGMGTGDALAGTVLNATVSQ